MVRFGLSILTVAKPQVVKPMKLCISFLVWEIHKPIVGDVGSNVGALQPGRWITSVWKRFPFRLLLMERRHPPWPLPRTYLRASARVAAKRLDCSRWPYPAQKKAAGANEQD